MVKLLFFHPDCSETTCNPLLQSQAGWFLQHLLQRPLQGPSMAPWAASALTGQGQAGGGSSSEPQLIPAAVHPFFAAAANSSSHLTSHFPALILLSFSFFSRGNDSGRACTVREVSGWWCSPLSIPILLPRGEQAGSKGSQISSGYYFWWEKTQQQSLRLDCMDTVPSRGAGPQLHRVAAATETSHGKRLPVRWL